MSPEAREKKARYERERRQRRRDLGLVTAEDREMHAFHCFVWYTRNAEQINARRAETRKKNLESSRAKDRIREARRNANPSEALRERWRRKDRLKRLRDCKDRPKQQHRIATAAEAAVPKSLPDHVRSGVVALLVERVYSGLLPMRIKAEHGKAALADYRRDVERFALQHVSLDAPVGEGGTTFGQMIGAL